MRVSARTLLGLVLATVAAGAIAAGIALVGPPGDARQQRLDVRRLADLRRIADAVEMYRDRTQALPESLEAVKAQGGWVEPPSDPETGAVYEYRVLDDQRYELCAVFSRPSDGMGPAHPHDAFWAHRAGRQCFALTVDAGDVRRPAEAVPK